jgi:hypothetical protein
MYGLPLVVPVALVSTTPFARFVNSNDSGPVSVPPFSVAPPVELAACLTSR